MTLQAQIKSLETQLSVLKAQLEAADGPQEPPGTFAGLYGVLSGKVSSSGRDIEKAKYRFDWEGAQET